MYFVSLLDHGPGQGEREPDVLEHDLEHHRQWHGQHHPVRRKLRWTGRTV